MPKKIVEVLVDAELLVAYPITLRETVGEPIEDEDFIDEAKRALEEDHFSLEVVSKAEFVVHDPGCNDL